MNPRKRVFIGSSFEARHQVERVAEILERQSVEPVKWIDIFRSGDIPLERIENIASSVNGALILATPDDQTRKRTIDRAENVRSPRANVMFEYGYFMGVLGRKTNRLALCKFDKADLPSDLEGITHIRMGAFDPTETAQIAPQAEKLIATWADNLSAITGRAELNDQPSDRQALQVFKLLYNKFYHLHNMLKEPAAYCRTIHRYDKQKSLQVFDEFHSYRMNFFRDDYIDFTCKDRTTGSVDLQLLHPPNSIWQILPNVAGDPWHKEIRAKCLVPSKMFFSKSIYYNGFQTENHDLGTRVEADTDEARLIADFSSIANWKDHISADPTAELIRDGEQADILPVIQLHEGIWSVTGHNLRRQDAIQLNFTLNW